MIILNVVACSKSQLIQSDYRFIGFMFIKQRKVCYFYKEVKDFNGDQHLGYVHNCHLQPLSFHKGKKGPDIFAFHHSLDS